MKGPGYPQGVPTPYAMHVHPYPTRFHGGIWTRPVFGFPSQQATSTVFIPGRDIDMVPDKPYTGPGIQGLGDLAYDVGNGVFRPGGYGGGVFDGNLAGAPALGKRGKSSLGESATATDSDKVNFPYGKYSAQTLLLQNALNKYLNANGFCPISADGKLGAATCGAAAAFRPGIDGNTAPTTCEDFKTVQQASSGCGTGPKPTPTPVLATPASISPSLPMSSSTKKVLGFIAGGLGAVAVVYYVKKRRR